MTSTVRKYVLALDQGTTSSRAIVFDRSGTAVAAAQQEFPQIFPSPGHVEHDPEAIWDSQVATARDAIARAGLQPADLAAIGVTNQRETTVLWERDSGRPIGNAIVWQSRITAPICDRLKAAGYEPLFREKTGLVVDAYFSGTKIKHILDSTDGLRARAARGEILFGTIDSFLIWRLTRGARHITDVTNASRTLLFNIHTMAWDDELLKILDVPRAMLPEVRSSSEVYGVTDPAIFGTAVPVAGIAGDQQAALFGQACFEPGTAKNTYGTGCFMLLNTGESPVPSQKGLLTTVAWQIGGKTTYALEGAVFVAGAAVQWLRDGLKAIQSSAEVEALMRQVPDTDGVYLVPAFVGLGAPYWDPRARGIIVGLTRNSSMAHVARAAVDAMAYQTRDVLQIMQEEAKLALTTLKVDGGAAANAMMLQFQADLLGVPVRRPVVAETTALGAAYLAGLAVGYWDGLDDVRNNWALDREFAPERPRAEMDQLCRLDEGSESLTGMGGMIAALRQVKREQWKAFLTTFAAWVIDAFDFTILTFVLVNIQQSFSVNAALAGLLGTVTLIFRVIGGIGAGTAADRWGRKPPIMFSIAWFTLFAFLSGLSTSYVMLFAFRGLFGIGMGGMWAAGVPLALEHWPKELRGIASGLLQGGFSFGFMLSSLVYQFGWPLVSHNPDMGWRIMLWTGVIPAFIILAVMSTVKESPVWLEQQRVARESGQPMRRLSVARLFHPDLRWVTIHSSLLMATFIFSYHSITYWYPTLLRNFQLAPLSFLIALNAGGLIGSVVLGQLSETRLGRRGAPTLGMIVGVLSAPMFLWSSDPDMLLLGAFLIGLGCSGAWGIVPGYLSERFPTEARAVGTGFAYHVGAGLGAFTPYLIGSLQDSGVPLASAMLSCIVVAGVLVLVMLWLGPETRGQRLDA